MQLSPKPNMLFEFFCFFVFVHFWNLHQILNNLKEKISLIADLFPNL